MIWSLGGFHKKKPSPADAEPEVFPPQLHQSSTVPEWLRDWVLFQMSRHGRTELPTGPGLCLSGSLGTDNAITPDGQLWHNSYELSGTDSTENWRVATEKERTSILVSVQKRRFPELIVLLPCKPPGAQACHECNGTGFLHADFVWCQRCGCLGWLA